mmetsp:Transcript_7695/g.16057  ORF Transcript_7695/g.16057 Transcript_7695/m.16057 type:complete len:317 (-) Transcript_7695:1166-2116(-)
MITSHPQILRGKTKELQFFTPKAFRPFWNDGVVGNLVNVAEARQALWSTTSQRKRQLFPVDRLKQDKSLLTGEATPDYLMFPHYASQAIFCTIPWVKLIVVLRDPIDRLYSHYNYLKPSPSEAGGGGGHRKEMLPFEEWVTRDIAVLQSVGVLPQNLSNIPTYVGTTAEQKGWRDYQMMIKPGKNNPGSDRHFVRSLYAPQLEQWIETMKHVGKDPQTDLRIVFSKDLKTNPNVTNDLLKWLLLSAHSPLSGNENVGLDSKSRNLTLQAPIHSMVTKYSSPPIRPEFRQYLQSTIFDHYNSRLFALLGQGPDEKVF